MKNIMEQSKEGAILMHQEMDYLVVEYQIISGTRSVLGVYGLCPCTGPKVGGCRKLLAVQYCGIFKYYSQMKN
jgi:hypothetical protein